MKPPTSPRTPQLAIRFPITGTHNSGKTTLCHEVVGRLMRRGLSVAYAPEPSRASRYLAQRRRGFEAQLDILAGTVANELEATRQGDIAVCDRSAVDVLAYTEALGNPQHAPHKLFMAAIQAFTDAYAPSYRVFFKTCWRFAMATSADPLRIGNDRFQGLIDQRIEHHLHRLAVPVIRLNDPITAAEEVERHIVRSYEDSIAALPPAKD